jgi:hypothetical protein
MFSTAAFPCLVLVHVGYFRIQLTRLALEALHQGTLLVKHTAAFFFFVANSQLTLFTEMVNVYCNHHTNPYYAQLFYGHYRLYMRY